MLEGTYPEVHYQDNPPEKVSSDSPHENGTNVPVDHVNSSDQRRRKRKRWLAILIAVIAVIAIAVGIGVGVGVGNKQKSDYTINEYGIDSAWCRVITS